MRIRLALPVALAVVASLSIPALAAQDAEPAERGPAAVAGELLVGYAPGATPAERTRARGRADVVLEERVVAADAATAAVDRVRVPAGKAREQAIRELESDPAVRYAEPNWVYQHDAVSNDPSYTNGSLWGMYGDATSPANQYGSQAGEAWAAGNTGSAGVYVGVIDEGLQVTHPDLAANVWTNPFDPVNGVDDDGNGYVDDVNGWDFNGNNNSVYDGSGDDHGTHVAGTIGAVGGNGVGVAGVAWDVTLISAKFLGPRGGTTANAVKAVDYLTQLKTDHGLNIVATNNSWGGGGYSQALFDAINRAGAAEILFVAAAGNGGSDQVGDNNDSTPHYPSSYANANIISVASITSSGARSGFSNYGATSVDLGAPGSGIYSTLPGGGYGSYSGTSMATPHVTGGVALYAAGGGGTAAGIKSAVLGAAIPTASLSGRVVTGGRLNVSGFVGGGGGGGTPNTPPTAAFTSSCSGLTCSFTDTSTDSDGTIASRAWSFGDGTGATTQNPSRTYAAAGTYTVTLTVTDDDGASANTSAQVTVSEPSAITLSATGYKVKGARNADLAWSGAAGASVDVIRNGVKVTTTTNDGTHTDSIGGKGGGTYTYQVCEAGTSTCSNAAAVVF